MDENEQRIRDSTDACIKSYEAWRTKPKDASVREALQEAVHELRKVASRLEIEMAVSERDEMADKPLPIPPHRSSRRPRGPQDDMDDDNTGNVDPSAVPQNRPRNNPGSRRPRPQNRGNGGHND